MEWKALCFAYSLLLEEFVILYLPKVPITDWSQWSYEEAQVFMAHMRRELKDLKIHAYLDVSVVYGRKPGGRPNSRPDGPHVASSGYTVHGMSASGLPENYQGLS
jgi:hypothetical protein